ncbi:MAG: hypothetical protein WD767_10755 [Alphaproteobacteria bacterium]
MSEYQAIITYREPRHFARDARGEIIPSGEMIRFEGKVLVAYIRPEIDLDAKKGAPFNGQILFVSELEKARPFESGQELEIVSTNTRTLQVIGHCVIQEKKQ